MAILLTAHELTKSYGIRPLFQNLNFVVESNDRIGLIGANGAGKSTLLKILAGELPTDEGSISLLKGVRIGYLSQTPKLPPSATIEAAVLESTRDPHAWESLALVQETLSKLELDSSRFPKETQIKALSGGWQKRVALARELVKEPELLLLDEPTNHLDIESILWLESFLARSTFGTVTITHDRLFLQRVSNRILELGKQYANGILDVRGNYADYLDTREQLMMQQQREEIKLKNRLRRETEWLRRGPKARTTKQQARIDRAYDLKEEVEELNYRNRSQTSQIEFQSTDNKPKKLLEAKGIAKSYGTQTLFKDFDLFLGPGSRIGLLGTNGSGKSTLIRVLLGLEPADAGSVFRSEALKVVYFQQTRDALDLNLTVLKTLCPTGDQVNYRNRLIHIRSYLSRFLFSPEQMDMKVAHLSGGEQSRLLIADLMLKEANVLVLDEPTNDLDIETLDILEECLKEFEGAIILVTHDRFFLDQVATEIIAFTKDHKDKQKLIRFADLSQWEAWKENEERLARSQTVAKPESVAVNSEPKKKKKLSYHEVRELASMEENIHKAEAELDKLQKEAEDPANQSNSVKLTEIYSGIAKAQEKVESLYNRWAELEAATK